jgi:hypothetical protein
MTQVTISKMNANVSEPFFTTKEFTNLIDALAFAKEVCELYYLDNFDNDTWQAGGISYDYRLIVK